MRRVTKMSNYAIKAEGLHKKYGKFEIRAA